MLDDALRVVGGNAALEARVLALGPKLAQASAVGPGDELLLGIARTAWALALVAPDQKRRLVLFGMKEIYEDTGWAEPPFAFFQGFEHPELISTFDSAAVPRMRPLTAAERSALDAARMDLNPPDPKVTALLAAALDAGGPDPVFVGPLVPTGGDAVACGERMCTTLIEARATLRWTDVWVIRAAFEPAIRVLEARSDPTGAWALQQTRTIVATYTRAALLEAHPQAQ